MANMINTHWFDRFIELLKDCGVDDGLIESVREFIFSDENLIGCKMGWEFNCFNKTKTADQLIDDFYSYLGGKRKEEGSEFTDFIKSSLRQIKIDFQKHKQENHSAKTNFLNLFMRQLLIRYPQDVEFKNDGSTVKKLNPNSSDGAIYALLGGVAVGHIHFCEERANIPTIQFTDFRTLAGLERLGLGTSIFIEFCKQIEQFKPKHSVVAWNVVAGKDGSKTYSKWGAYPIMASAVHDYWTFDPAPVNEYSGGMIYYFSPTIIHNFAKRKNCKYGKQTTATNIKGC